ncbi:hypothetical protein N7488_002197 [Penicillium malachiteum]|nr:hypothetical protein N7488_002197 [Penicillium malachiteum]
MANPEMAAIWANVSRVIPAPHILLKPAYHVLLPRDKEAFDGVHGIAERLVVIRKWQPAMEEQVTKLEIASSWTMSSVNADDAFRTDRADWLYCDVPKYP